MPIYEYNCKKCNKNFEVLIMDSDKPACPCCGNMKVKRLISSCAFVSKGSGGETVSASAGAASCTGCHSTNCSSCGV